MCAAKFRGCLLCSSLPTAAPFLTFLPTTQTRLSESSQLHCLSLNTDITLIETPGLPRTMMMLISLVIVLLCIQSSFCEFIPSVTYVSFIYSNFDGSSKNRSDLINSQVIITNSDDSPIVEVQLPFVFPYFGDFIDRIYASPNGFVQTTAAAITSPAYTSPCLIVYDGVIAGYLADLTTHTPLQNANVTVVQYNEVTSIQYRGLNVYGYTNASYPQLDFDINLYSDGSVSVDYIKITPLQDIDNSATQACHWLTGLVATDYSISTLRGEVTSQQISIQTDVWATRGKGVYPAARADVKNQSRFVACPVSTSWCATPATIGPSSAYLNITTLSLGCINKPSDDVNSTIDIAVQIEASSDPSFVVDLTHAAPCIPLSEEESTPLTSAPIAFQCDLSGINLPSYLNVGDVYLHILWKRFIDSPSVSSYAAVGETVLPVKVRYNTTLASNTSCALNTPMGSCDECDVCNSHVTPSALSCLSVTCFNTTEYVTNASFSSFAPSEEVQSLYASPSCSQSCAKTFIEQLDKSDECCAVQDIDCRGNCNGGAVEGLAEVDGYTICCASDDPPDCEGVCGGPSVTDTCNVCKGNDTGILCPTGFVVDTGSNVLNSNNHLATSYDAINALHVSIVPVTVFNTFNTSLFIMIEEVSSDSFTRSTQMGPVFDLPGGTLEVGGYQNYTLYIASNMTDLFNGKLHGWEVKTLSLR